MSEGPQDGMEVGPARHLHVVEHRRATDHDPRDNEMNLATRRSSTGAVHSIVPPDAPRWGGLVGVDLPDGVGRHPRLLGVVQEALGRFCTMSTSTDAVRIGFPATGSTLEEAEQDCQAVATHLVSLLGLTPAAVVEERVFERDLSLLSEGTPPDLTVV